MGHCPLSRTPVQAPEVCLLVQGDEHGLQAQPRRQEDDQSRSEESLEDAKVPQDAEGGAPARKARQQTMRKPLRNYSRRELLEFIEREAQSTQYSYQSYADELNRRQSRLLSIIVTIVAICNVVVVAADIIGSN